MNCFASFYREETGTNSSAVLLQEVYLLRRKLQVILGVIYVPQEQCADNGMIQGRFLQWFYGEGLEIISRKGIRGMGKICDSFLDCLKKNEGEQISMAGTLIVENQCLMFGKGQAQIYLLNSGNHGSECTPLSEKWADKDRWIRIGSMEENVGLLLTTDALNKEIMTGSAFKMLDMNQIQCPEQAERALKQLGRWAVQEGQHHLTTLLMVRKESKYGD
jgi:hypothetical protein